MKQRKRFPAVIAYLEVPVFVNFTYRDEFAFPLLGTVLNYEVAGLLPYAGYEIALDPDVEGGYRDMHHNVRLGISRRTKRKNWISLEIGLHDIGRRSYITNQGVGFPCIQFGFSFPVIGNHE
ncbi:MAG: hypothetical protein JW863_05375 [Chitinispirillaceae bacterium]|nr:hypothetical protein [Chitinispirillaceae bacterium]